MKYEFSNMAPAERYRLLVNTVTPRPIAWVVSRNEDGLLNCAPYSFFNVLGSDPPLCVLGIGQRAEGDPKDTARNILATGEYTIGLVKSDDARLMVDTGVDAPRDVSELDVLGIETKPADHVSVPLIASAPVSLECRLWKAIDTGGNFHIMLGEIVAIHIDDEFLSGPPERPRIDGAALDLIGRSHGSANFLRGTDLFEEPRVTWPLPERALKKDD